MSLRICPVGSSSGGRNMGRCGSISPAEFGVRSFKPVTGWRQCSSRLRREKASRPPAVIDSLAALAFNEAWRRACGSWQPTRRDPRRCAGGLTTHCLPHSKECERDRTNSPGLSLHVRPGGRQKSGAATAGVHALRAGRLLTFFVIPPAAPRHKKETQDETVDHALHHILCRHT